LCSRATRIVLLIALSLALSAGEARAKVFYSRSEALALAFPDADHIEDRTHVLSEEQAARIESLAH
jgi:hypothetical protein